MVQTIQLRSHIGADGVLKIDVPTGVANSDVEVVVVVSELPVDVLGWPAGFFERFEGALAGDPIERGAQGSFEERDGLAVE